MVMATVPARRIIAVSPDPAFGAWLRAALGAADAAAEVAVHGGLDSLGAGEPASLYVLHLDGELAGPPVRILARVPGTAPVLAVLPHPDLAAAVTVMQVSERVAGVVAAEDLDARHITAAAARVVVDDVLGLSRAMPPGTEVHTQAVGDHREKTQCLAAVGGFAEASGASRPQRAAIEQCLDEMLMNALYDAPVDARGRHIFAEVPARERVAQRTAQHAVVQHACDGRWLAVSVRDAFGSLERRTLMRHLDKGLHAAQQIDRKVGGAGLGLYLMAMSSTALHFHVLPGIATEALCLFDLQAPGPRAEQLGFFVQRDPAGRVPTGPVRRRSAAPRRRARIAATVAVAAAAAVAVAGGVTAWRRGGGGGGGGPGSAAAVPVPVIELDSQPTGAAVELDGQPAGSTPLTLTTLAPGVAATAVLKRPGYRPATVALVAPPVGEVRRVLAPLARNEDLVPVSFVSRPPGAEVIRAGQDSGIDRTYTPAELFVEAGQVQHFTLVMPRRVPLVIEPFTPARGEKGIEKGGELAAGAVLRFEGPAGGRVTVRGAPHCAEAALPLDCTLAPGGYKIDYVAPDGAKSTRTVTVGAEDATERFAPPPPK